MDIGYLIFRRNTSQKLVFYKKETGCIKRKAKLRYILNYVICTSPANT